MLNRKLSAEDEEINQPEQQQEGASTFCDDGSSLQSMQSKQKEYNKENHSVTPMLSTPSVPLNFSCHPEDDGSILNLIGSRISHKSARSRRRRRKKFLGINLTTCKYDCVRRVSKRFGFREVDDGDDWTLFWTDYSVSLERVIEMKTYQKINHFPGMSEICRKDSLARNMNRLWKQFPKDYGIFPRTWCLPADYGDFQLFYRMKKNKTFILKPDSGSQGKGIYLTKTPKQDIKPGEDLICQQYISKPFLIDGFKFDLRIYVLGNIYMHLTNYAIQKYSNEFIRDEESGSKRRLSVIDKWFEDNGYDLNKIWNSIDDVIIKTLISAHPIIKHNYRTCFPNHVKGSACFEILGFDIILDRKLKPWVLEVNHSPSFTTDSKLDREIKEQLIYDTLVLVNFSLCDRRKYIEEEKKKVRERLLQKPKENKEKKNDNNTQDKTAEKLKELMRYEDDHLGNFRRIYPNNNEEEYERFFANSCSLFQETAASKARSECAKQQREEIKQKSDFIEMMRKRNGIQTHCAAIDGMRPESGQLKQLRRTAFKRLHIESKDEKDDESANRQYDESFLPIAINEREELERVANMMQRDSLLITLGIPDLVYRLLYGMKTIGSKKQGKSNNNSSQCQRTSKHKGNIDHGCKSNSKSLPSMKTFPCSAAILTCANRNQNKYKWNTNLTSTDDQRSKHFWAASGPPSLSRKDRQLLASAGINFSPQQICRQKILPKRSVPFLKMPSYNHHDNDSSHQTTGNDRDRSESLANVNERRDSFIRSDNNNNSTTNNNATGSNRFLTSCMSSSAVAMSPPIRLFQEDKEATGARGLSVVSSPAPMQFRDDVFVDNNNNKCKQQNTSLLRSTKAQRARGVSNNVRIKQMELLESRTTVTS